VTDPAGAISDDDPVAAALRLRASDADRERVAGVIREAYADGRLTSHEMEERIGEAYSAMTYADLVPVLRDLPAPAGTIAPPAAVDATAMRASTPPVVSGGPAPAMSGGSLVAVFSGFERKGRWTVPETLQAICIFGGGEVDLTDAVLTSRETTITVVCVFGGLSITVPDGMFVRSEVVGILGGVEVSDGGDPNGPTLHIKGAAVLGGVEVKRTSQRRRHRNRKPISPE
jgi:hypothetical protein